MEAAMDDEEIVVYLTGSSHSGDVWYRVVLDTSPSPSPLLSERLWKNTRGQQGQTIDKDLLSELEALIISLPAEKQFDEREKERLTIYPVARIGFNGGWTVIGDDIYWAGGCRDDPLTMKVILYKDLIKHNVHHQNLSSWERVCSLNIPRESPFLAAVGTRIAILAGTDVPVEPNVVHGDWIWSGELYNLDTQSLSYANSDIMDFVSNDKATTVVEYPNNIVFYSMDKGSMLFVDASTGSIKARSGPKPSMFSWKSCPFELFITARNSLPVFHMNTFYWFTDQLQLYGFDTVRCTWLQSECLQQQLPPIKVNPPHYPPLYPFLLGLPNGKFLVIVSENNLYAMASFSVVKNDHKSMLYVNVEHIQYFLPDDPLFSPYEGIAIRLKNTEPGATQG